MAKAKTIPFKTILARAEKRKGGPGGLKKLLPAKPNLKALEKLSDDRMLAEMTKRVFSAGFAWSRAGAVRISRSSLTIPTIAAPKGRRRIAQAGDALTMSAPTASSTSRAIPPNAAAAIRKRDGSFRTSASERARVLRVTPCFFHERSHWSA